MKYKGATDKTTQVPNKTYFECCHTLRSTKGHDVVNPSFIAVEESNSRLHPAFVASRFKESSLSPWARTWPLSANDVDVLSARPLPSTSAITTCTDAWSFEVMRRSLIRASLDCNLSAPQLLLTGCCTLARNVKVNKKALREASVIN